MEGAGLPARPHDSASPAPIAGPPDEPAELVGRRGERSYRLLLVEDDAENAGTLAELLEINGFDVRIAADGPAALEAVKTHPTDAIVLDVLLPGMNGFEVCRQLRADPANAGLVIIMLTGLDDIPSKLEGLDTGADDYLVKPVMSRELMARIRRRLEARDAGSIEVRKQRLLAIGQLATAICHEINNPLTAALGTLDLVLFRGDLSSTVRRELEQVQTALMRISRIVSRLDEVEDRTVIYVGSDQMIDLSRGRR